MNWLQKFIKKLMQLKNNSQIFEKIENESKTVIEDNKKFLIELKLYSSGSQTI